MRFLPVSEAAKRLGIPERTLRYKLNRGEIRGERKNGKWLVAMPKNDRTSEDNTSDNATPMRTKNVNNNKHSPPPQNPRQNPAIISSTISKA